MIVGFSGKMRAGKDTGANVLVNKFGFKKVSFADSLKEICSDSFGLKLDFFYNDNLKDKPFDVPLVINVEDIENLAYEIMKYNIGVSQDQIHAMVTEAAGQPMATPRKLLQFIGTDVVRKHVDNNCWIKIVQNKLSTTNQHITIADSRFKNEREVIENTGGINILVKRPSVELAGSGHSSENDLGQESDYKFVFDNNGTQEEYERLVEETIGKLL